MISNEEEITKIFAEHILIYYLIPIAEARGNENDKEALKIWSTVNHLYPEFLNTNKNLFEEDVAYLCAVMVVEQKKAIGSIIEALKIFKEILTKITDIKSEFWFWKLWYTDEEFLKIIASYAECIRTAFHESTGDQQKQALKQGITLLKDTLAPRWGLIQSRYHARCVIEYAHFLSDDNESNEFPLMDIVEVLETFKIHKDSFSVGRACFLLGKAYRGNLLEDKLVVKGFNDDKKKEEKTDLEEKVKTQKYEALFWFQKAVHFLEGRTIHGEGVSLLIDSYMALASSFAISKSYGQAYSYYLKAHRYVPEGASSYRTAIKEGISALDKKNVENEKRLNF